MFADTFIRRPILASVCSLVLILGGLIAIPTMPVAQYPSLAPPVITVTAFYTGANAQEVETAVTANVGKAIVDHAKRREASLIALATQGMGGVQRFVVGSVADKLIRTAPMPVLVIP